MNVSPELLVGVGLRALALVQIIAFASLWRDVLGLAGSRGVHPVAPILAASRRDYGWRRFVYFPSVLHLGASDSALRGWIVVGAAASCVALLGGPLTPYAFAVAWLVYLSFDVAIDLLYPWDALLLEASFLAILAPPLAPLFSSLASAEAAHPIWVWAMRFLAFRVVFGFGKYKFFGPGELHLDYLKSFLVTQPMPRPLGLRVQALPVLVHRLALLALFVVEVICPWLWLGGPQLRWIASAAVIALMIGIQLTGNFGFFNVAMIALCILAATPTASAFDLALGNPTLTWDTAHVAGLALLLAGLVHLPFQSWVARAWMYWPDLARRAGRAGAFVQGLVRAIAPLRLVHAYGVFAREPGPRAQWVARFEASMDGQDWAPYRYRYYPSDPSFAGTSVSPAFPRFDHGVIYEAMGLGVGNLMAPLVGGGNPYRASRALYFERVQARLLEASAPVLALFGAVPFGDTPPAQVRVVFEQLAYDERSRTYRRICLGEHLPARSLSDVKGWDALPMPSSFLPDERVWSERAQPRSWDDAADLRLDALWRRLAERDDALSAEEEDTWLHAAWTLRSRTLPLEGELELELWLRTLYVAATGSATLRAAWADPHGALHRFTLEQALEAFARLRPTWVAFHARKARIRELTMRGAQRRVPSFAPGVLRLLPLLAARGLPGAAGR